MFNLCWLSANCDDGAILPVSRMLFYFSMFGYFELDWYLTIGRVALVALVATLVESLPTKGGVNDNISVPMASMLLAYLTFSFHA